jgi:hypothetical protein
MNLMELHNNVTNVISEMRNIVLSLAIEAEPSIVELNRSQLWEGKTNEGKDITPKYSENPFFKSKESAEKYANWKQKITPGKTRKKDVPNLFIDGTFYDSIYAKLYGDEININSNIALGTKIIAVHKKVLGLNKESLRVVSNAIKEPLINTLKDELTRSN